MIKEKIIPIKTYFDVCTDKTQIYKENRHKSGVYRWYNMITKESYVGSSVNLTDRMYSYLSYRYLQYQLLRYNSLIYKSLLNNNHNNFRLDILEYSQRDLLKSREQYYINILNPKYNISKNIYQVIKRNK
jgi:group I intron endonuclease